MKTRMMGLCALLLLAMAVFVYAQKEDPITGRIVSVKIGPEKKGIAGKLLVDVETLTVVPKIEDRRTQYQLEFAVEINADGVKYFGLATSDLGTRQSGFGLKTHRIDWGFEIDTTGISGASVSAYAVQLFPHSQTNLICKKNEKCLGVTKL
ncbi:MAG: hypothetical protein U1E27_03380, partial [Kiritimatiellia bacterium]|nr:hypothetical protein [Kiritimatiellia bacterium]